MYRCLFADQCEFAHGNITQRNLSMLFHMPAITRSRLCFREQVTNIIESISIFSKEWLCWQWKSGQASRTGAHEAYMKKIPIVARSSLSMSCIYQSQKHSRRTMTGFKSCEVFTMLTLGSGMWHETSPICINMAATLQTVNEDFSTRNRYLCYG